LYLIKVVSCDRLKAMHGSFSRRKKFKPKKGKRIFPTVKEVASEASDSQGKDEVDAKYVMSVDSSELHVFYLSGMITCGRNVKPMPTPLDAS
jgi:hypothetical protein